MTDIEESMGVGAVAGIGAQPSDPSTVNPEKFAEPGVPRKKKNRVVVSASPLKRFREWLELE